jgi:hypothetical protein
MPRVRVPNKLYHLKARNQKPQSPHKLMISWC